jgi:hypothetical protein
MAPFFGAVRRWRQNLWETSRNGTVRALLAWRAPGQTDGRVKAIGMELGRLKTAIALMAALAFLGLATALLTNMAVLASEPTQDPSPTATDTPAQQPAATQTPIPLELPVVTDKPHLAVSPRDPSAKEIRVDKADSGQGNVYTWEDGDRTLRAVLQTDLVVQETTSNTPEDVVVEMGTSNSIVRLNEGHGQAHGPVFRSESGGGLMALPGGVVLVLDEEWSQSRIEEFFSENNILAHLWSALEFLDNGFLVQTEPGLPSLELANELAAQEGVVISSPNWWREVEPR